MFGLHRQPPVRDVDESELEVSRAPHAAAGVRAVSVAMKRAVEQMGLGRSARTLLKLNQADGFDCQGCAWPDPDVGHRHTAEFCENGAKAVTEEATRRRVGAEFFARHSMQELADKSDYWLGQQGRITEPVVLREGGTHYEPISWPDAHALMAQCLLGLDSPDQAAFYTSGKTSNEAAFIYQLLVRAFGTNNLPDCSNMCHESSGTALIETIGIGKGSVSLDDIHQASLLVVVGQNPGTNHPRMLSALERAKANGAKIIAINPLEEAGLVRFKNPQRPRGIVGSGTAMADLHLPVRLNGDLALFQAIGALLLEWDAAEGGIVDHDFLDRHTTGFADYAEHLRELDWAQVERATGLSRAQIAEAARMFADSPATVTCWAMGITQHHNAVATIKEIVNVALLQGNIGRPGAGLCPVRGHSNVQGDRTMGVWERAPEHFLDSLAREFDFEPPREHGLDTVDTIRAMRDGTVRFFFAMGGNFVSAAPDTAVTEAGMRNCDLTVHVSTKLNRSHVVTGRQALILPALGRSERDLTGGREQRVTVEDSMSVVHASRGPLPPASPHLRSEVDIICGLAEALIEHGTPVVDQGAPSVVEEGALAPVSKPRPVVDQDAPSVVEEGALAPVSKPRPVVDQGAPSVVEEGALAPVSKPLDTSALARIPWSDFRSDYTEIRRRIANVVPGCAAYDEKASRPGGFVLPHPPRDSRTFETTSGRAVFTASPLKVLEVPEGRLLLQTLRSHDQFNTTIYGLDDRYRGVKGGRRVVFVHPEDIRMLGFADGDRVDLVGEWLPAWGGDGSERCARDFRIVAYDQPRGCAAAYYPETNPLVPLDATAEGSNTPASKAVAVRLERPGVAVAGPSAGQQSAGDHKDDVEPTHLS